MEAEENYDSEADSVFSNLSTDKDTHCGSVADSEPSSPVLVDTAEDRRARVSSADHSVHSASASINTLKMINSPIVTSQKPSLMTVLSSNLSKTDESYENGKL